MAVRRSIFRVAFLVAALSARSFVASGQEESTQAPPAPGPRPGMWRIGSFYLTPKFRIGSVGLDTNVLYTPTDRTTDVSANGGSGLGAGASSGPLRAVLQRGLPRLPVLRQDRFAAQAQRLRPDRLRLQEPTIQRRPRGSMGRVICTAELRGEPAGASDDRRHPPRHQTPALRPHQPALAGEP